MNTKNIEQFIVALCSLAAALIVLFVADPTKAQNLAVLITGTVGPTLAILAGIIFVWVKGGEVAAQQKIELAKLNLEQSKIAAYGPRNTSTATGSGYTYTISDVQIVLNEAIADIQSTGVTVDKLNTAEYDYAHMSNYDLRPVAKEKRVALSKAFLDKSLALLEDAWTYATNIQTIPTADQAANKTTNMYYFKKEYEKANPDTACTNSMYDTMSVLLGYFNNVYSAQAGIDTLIGVTVDYSTFGGGLYTPTSLGWNAAACVV